MSVLPPLQTRGALRGSVRRSGHCRSLALVVILVGAWPAGALRAQQLPVGDVWEEYLRVLQVAGLAGGGSFTVRPLAPDAALGSVDPGVEHPWKGYLVPPVRRSLGRSATVSAADPGVRAFVNSTFADGWNDGPVWQGKGLTLARFRSSRGERAPA